MAYSKANVASPNVKMLDAEDLFVLSKSSSAEQLAASSSCTSRMGSSTSTPVKNNLFIHNAVAVVYQEEAPEIQSGLNSEEQHAPPTSDVTCSPDKGGETTEQGLGRKPSRQPRTDGPAKKGTGYKSSFFIFKDENLDRIRKLHPHVTKGAEITKLLGEAWKCLSDEDKAEYAERAREKWMQETGKASKAAGAGKKKGTGYKSSYFLFMDDYRDVLRQDHPGAKGAEITKLLGEAWKCLSDEDKAEYAERAREKWMQETGKTSQPASKKKGTGYQNSYILFVGKNRAAVKTEFPALNAFEIAATLGERWREMTVEQKGHYKRKADALNMAKRTEVQD